MAASERSENVGADSSKTDPNNNSSPSTKNYSLRPRTTRRCDDQICPAEPEVWRSPRSKKKHKSMPLSKYRRKSANARERSRMREINEAFEALRRAIPQMSSRERSSEKLTKITTLRLAMRYISALDSLLREQEVESPLPSDLFTPFMASDLGQLNGYQVPMITSDSLFNHSSYVFDETSFITDLS